MKNHIITPFGMGVRALALLALCATATGCKDDFTLDEEKPAWLGESVLGALQQRGEFNNYLNLMHDLGMDEILSRTGSRTVFAAPDSAFASFYAKNATLAPTNPWHNATSYDRLSNSQKLLLAKCSMLNNAITMETLSSDEASGSKPVTRGVYMRRNTMVDVTDTVLRLNSNQLPYSYNKLDEDGKIDEDYWGFYRSSSYSRDGGPASDDGKGRGVYLTSGDGTSNMMLCFTTEHMASNAMVSSDLELVLGTTRKPTDVHVYDAKIMEQDITCQNGYVEMMQKVIAPLPNMAEVIRTNGQTNIFSHILERFSLPVYVEAYNNAYRNLHDEFSESDTIYTKWYMSKVHSLSRYVQVSGNKATIVNGKNSTYQVTLPLMLKFDPSWNAISASTNAETTYSDMAAMFVPNDRTLLREFKAGGRLFTLVDTYAKEYLPLVEQASEGNLEGLYRAIDQIPMTTIGSFVDNVMFSTFIGSVQSKFGALTNDASEPIFLNGECKVDKVELACNGAVYITDAVYPPANYSSVAAPAYISKDKLIMKWAIYDGDNTTTGTDLMKLNYYAYLKAMSSVFTMFIPDDDALNYYYDPASFTTKNPRRLSFQNRKPQPGLPPVSCTSYTYDKVAGTSGNQLKTDLVDNDDVMNRLKDILDSHTIVHNDTTELMTGVLKDDYYLTKGGMGVKVIRDPNNGYVIGVKGGFQLENEDMDDATVWLGVKQANVKNRTFNSPGGNGDTYILDAPIIPPSKSVYTVMTEHDDFSEFLDLCEKKTSMTGVTTEEEYFTVDQIIDDLGLLLDSDGQNSAQLVKKYKIFDEDNMYPDQNVSFFNNYHYTIYVPSNDAMQRAYAEGLPSWDEIEQEYNDNYIHAEEAEYDDENNEIKPAVEAHLDEAVRPKLRAKIQYLINFIRLHFQDQSVFADRTRWNNYKEYASSCFYTPTGDDADGNFIKLRIRRNGHYSMTVQSLSQEDGDNVLAVSPEININGGSDGREHNIMARDVALINTLTNKGPGKGVAALQTMKNISIEASSSAVLHRIDDVLLLPKSTDFKMKPNGRFPDFDDPMTAEKLARRFKIVNKSNPKI